MEDEPKLTNQIKYTAKLSCLCHILTELPPVCFDPYLLHTVFQQLLLLFSRVWLQMTTVSVTFMELLVPQAAWMTDLATVMIDIQ